jgi:hypothetical protein
MYIPYSMFVSLIGTALYENFAQSYLLLMKFEY